MRAGPSNHHRDDSRRRPGRSARPRRLPPVLSRRPLEDERPLESTRHPRRGPPPPTGVIELLCDDTLAKTLCEACPALTDGLAGALERQEPWGVWGGELFVQGAIVASKRPRGRPRKNPAAA